VKEANPIKTSITCVLSFVKFREKENQNKAMEIEEGLLEKWREKGNGSGQGITEQWRGEYGKSTLYACMEKP
jgi:hypothetical protein